jgi:hypothetical protein
VKKLPRWGSWSCEKIATNKNNDQNWCFDVLTALAGAMFKMVQ